MDFIIATDSTSDLTKEQLREMDIVSCELLYFVNDVMYGDSDANQLKFNQFYDAMRLGARTSTSMVNEQTAKDFLENLLSDGKNVLYLAFDSALSGTYENFKRVADELNATHENKVYVVDSKCASGGEGLFVTLVNDKRMSGATFEETCTYADEVRDRVLHYFVVDNLKYLARGGRLSKGSAFFGNMLNIKPVLHVDEIGRLVPIKKVSGRVKSLRMLVEKMEDRYNRESETVYITHGDCFDDAKFVADAITEKFGITPKIMPLSFVIGSHSGPGTVALFFTGDNRAE
ncbi:MAG: DegV family protein [Clostridiales bacterium]|nr:DegV family protein [Clostridiales bacterium]